MKKKYIFIIIFILCIISIIVKIIRSIKFKPKGYIKNNNKIVIKHSSENYKDNYSIDKVPKDIDTIVIGSGFGSLSTAAILSKVGKKVLVLEKEDCAGGLTRSLNVNNCFSFSAGLHYVGVVDTWKDFLDAITESKIKWKKMGMNNNNIYDQIHIGDKKYFFRGGRETIKNDMINFFPNERNAIIKYFQLVYEAISDSENYFYYKIFDENSFIIQQLRNRYCKNIIKYSQISAYDVISSLTNNEELIAVLCGTCGNYGQPPKEASFYIHALCAWNYIDGGWYPEDGPSELSKNIIPVIESTGGRVLVNQGVKKIIIKNNIAIGVITENNDYIYSKNVVSGTGLKHTYFNLVGKNHVPRKMIQNINEIGQSTNCLFISIGIEGYFPNLIDSNIWHYPNNNIDEALDKFYENPETDEFPYFMSIHSVNKCKKMNKHSCIFLIEINDKCKEKIKDNKIFLNLFLDKVINKCLFKHFPQTKNHVVFSKIEIIPHIYGLNIHKKRFLKNDWLKPYTNIKNLYLTGQDVYVMGVISVMYSGIMTTSCMLNYNNIYDSILDRDIFKDIINISND